MALSLKRCPEGLGPAGRYPAPLIHGARTFLPGDLSVLAGAAVQPTDALQMDAPRCPVNSANLGLWPWLIRGGAP